MNNFTATATAASDTTEFGVGSDWIEMGRNEDGEMNLGDEWFVTATLDDGKVLRFDLGRDSMGYHEDEDGCGGEYIIRFDGEAAGKAALAVINTSGVECFEHLMASEFYHWRNVYGSESHDERDLMDDDELARCYF